MMRSLSLCLTILAVLVSLGGAPAAAASLDELRQSGALGERYDGYVVVRSGGGGAAEVAAQVNAERRRIYETRAKEQGISVDQVGTVYAPQIFSRAPAGTYFQAADGSWSRK
jgi:uncharacterized protein YdbL (DUF1318 family)